MTKRKIIKIDETKCDGCGICVPNCPEGAIQIIDNKARLISDLFCDGLGACIGHCPRGAIDIEEREAEVYDESRVIENIIKGGKNVIKAHLEHLKDHGDTKYLGEAINILKAKGIDIPELGNAESKCSGCPGMQEMDLRSENTSAGNAEEGSRKSRLRQWPVQLHIVSPDASCYREQDVVLSADCVAYALADFHKDYLDGKSIAIACPKLDAGQEIYTDKIKALIDRAMIRSLTVIIMEVPCCGGLLRLAQRSAAETSRKIPIRSIVVSIKGEVLKDETVA